MNRPFEFILIYGCVSRQSRPSLPLLQNFPARLIRTDAAMWPTEIPPATSRIADHNDYAALVVHLKVLHQALLLELDRGAYFFKLLLEGFSVGLGCSFLYR